MAECETLSANSTQLDMLHYYTDALSNSNTYCFELCILFNMNTFSWNCSLFERLYKFRIKNMCVLYVPIKMMNIIYLYPKCKPIFSKTPAFIHGICLRSLFGPLPTKKEERIIDSVWANTHRYFRWEPRTFSSWNQNNFHTAA